MDSINDSLYLNIVSRFENAVSVWEFEDLKNEFLRLGNFKESFAYSKKCEERIKNINAEKRENDYCMAITCFEKAGTLRELEALKDVFQNLGDYKDSSYYLIYCDDRITELNSGSGMVPNRVSHPKNSSFESSRTATGKKVNSVDEKKQADNVYWAKSIRTAILLILYVPVTLLLFLVVSILILSGEFSEPAAIISLILILIFNISKIVFCFVSFSQFWIEFEKKIPLIGLVGSIKSIIVQTMVRLAIQYAITHIVYFFGIMIIAPFL